MASSSTVYGDFKKKTVQEDEVLNPKELIQPQSMFQERILKDHAKFLVINIQLSDQVRFMEKKMYFRKSNSKIFRRCNVR